MCQILLTRVLSPDTSKLFSDRIDTEVVNSFSQFLLKVIEISPLTLIHSQHLPAIVHLFTQTLTYVAVRDL